MIHGGAHVGTVVVVEDAESIRHVLEPVYAALGLDWDPATVGAVERPWEAVHDARAGGLCDALRARPTSLDAETLDWPALKLQQ